MGAARLGVVLAVLGSPLAAEVDLVAFHACLETQIEANQPAAACVQAQHDFCFGFDPDVEPASATLCFVEAKEVWSGGIRAQLEAVEALGDEDIAAVAGIEVKYDLLANLLQCDRMHDLARLTDTPAEALTLQKARCEATSAGLVLTKLTLQSRSLTTGAE